MDTLKENFLKIKNQAQKDGVQVELLIAGGEQISLGFSKRKLESFESTQSQVAGFRVIAGASQGYAYTENLSEESLLRSYRDALANAKTVQGSSTLPLSLVKPGAELRTLDIDVEENIPMSEKMEIARKLEENCLNADNRVQSVPYSSFDQSRSFKRILNSEGLDQKFSRSSYSGYSYVLAKENESAKTDGESFFTRKFSEIPLDKVTHSSVQKALARLGATPLATGQYAVVIDRCEVPVLVHMFSSYLSAQTVDEGKSLFAGKLGQSIASEHLSLVDDPFDLRGSAVRPFDDEGSPSQTTILFENGVLKNFLTNLEYSKKMNLPHTSSASRSPASSMGIGASNLVMKKGDQSIDQLLSSHSKVVHLTHFAGGLHAGFNSATGDISMPAEGFLYENGKKIRAVDQFVMSGNILEVLKNIEAVGNEYNLEGSSVLCPDLLIRSMSFAGK